MPSLLSKSPFRIVVAYSVVSAAYIYCSDALLLSLHLDAASSAGVQTFKGIGFVIITAALLFLLIRRHAKLVARNQHQIAAINQKLEGAQKLAKLGYWSHDLRNNTVFWSDEMYKMYAVDPSGFTPSLQAVVNMTHPDDRCLLQPWSEEVFPLGSTEFEHRIITDSGKERRIFERVTVVLDERMRPLKLEGISIDITEAYEKQQRIARQGHALQQIAWMQSHVIRAPLVTLLGLIDLLRSRHEMEIDDSEVIRDIVHTAGKLDKVIREIVERTENVEATEQL